MMSWIYLAIAVIFEIAVGIAAGKAAGFTRLWWTIATLVAGGIATSQAVAGALAAGAAGVSVGGGGRLHGVSNAACWW